MVISRNQISRKLINNVKRVLHENSAVIDDAMSYNADVNTELLAASRVILSVLAELAAPLTKRVPAELSGTYLKMVKDQKELIVHELKRKG